MPRVSRQEHTPSAHGPQYRHIYYCPNPCQAILQGSSPCNNEGDFLIVDDSGIPQGDIHHNISSPLLSRIRMFFSSFIPSSHTVPPPSRLALPRSTPTSMSRLAP